LLPSLQATTAVIPPVEVTAALTSASVVMQAGHITGLLGFHSSCVPFSGRHLCAAGMSQL
jgi:hypothetical protein